MIYYIKIFLVAGFFFFPTTKVASAQSSSTEVIQGRVCENVYYDMNSGCASDAVGLEGIMVSNQREVVLTDENGFYELPVGDGGIIFISKPAEYQYVLDNENLPVFYHLHQPNGSPDLLEYPGMESSDLTQKTVDFALVQSEKQDEFTAVIFGDPQPRDHTELSYFRDDIISELTGVDADFTMVLGDIMYDDLSFFNRYNQLMASLEMPVFNVLGNHDMNYDADQFDSNPNRFSRETYKSFYGPAYYSFEHGDVHFIVMDNINYMGRSEETGRPQYEGYLDQTHLEWIKNNLEFVPEDKLIVLASHLPLYGMEHDRGNINTLNRAELFELLEDYDNVLYLGGHRHLTYQHFLGEEFGRYNPGEIHHITLTAACGSWWSGPLKKNGVPVSTQQDGVPNGYHLFKFNGNNYTELYKAAGKPDNYQMRIESPGSSVLTADLIDADILVNVFNGSERSEVRYRINDGEWSEMKRQEIAYSPFFKELFSDYSRSATPTNHIWSVPMPDVTPGVYRIDVWTRDMYGQEFEQSKVIEVK